MNETNEDPIRRAQKAARQARLPRFYKEVSIEQAGGGFALRLDGRAVRTPGKAVLAVPSAALADEIAGEWRAQGKEIDPATMPLTRLANTVIDRISGAGASGPVIDEIIAYAGCDLLCYRAEVPEGLVARQCEAWDPVLAWAEEALGARFRLAAGIVHVEQDPECLARLRQDIEKESDFVIGALAVITNLTGSALLAIALLRGRLIAEDAWGAAHVDEDWQISQWGRDEEAEARRAFRWGDMQAAARVIAALEPIDI